MKFWKNWPYWLRGGVVGGIFPFVWVILLYGCMFTIPGGFIYCPNIFLPESINLFTNLLPKVSDGFILITILCFIVGSIFGALANKKKSSQ